jgi:hypothetical protein
MHPAQFSIAPANSVDDRIYRVTDHTIDTSNAGIDHHFRDLICCCFCHGSPPYVVVLGFSQILRRFEVIDDVCLGIAHFL